jgi:hypothetical protein
MHTFNPQVVGSTPTGPTKLAPGSSRAFDLSQIRPGNIDISTILPEILDGFKFVGSTLRWSP